MKKAIIFILGVNSCISGSAPQTKLLIPRQYNAEATQKLQEQMTTILKLLYDTNAAQKIQASSLSEIESLIKDKGANPNSEVHIKTAFGGERDVSFFMFILAIVPSVEESDYSLVITIIKTALHHGFKMVIQPDYAHSFITTIRMITGDSPNVIREIFNAVENPQQKKQNVDEVNKALNDLLALGKEQIQAINSETDKVRKIMGALEGIKVQPAVVNIK